MTATHFARINTSQRVVPVTRWGRCLVVHHGGNHVSTCTYDARFTLYPKGTRIVQAGAETSLHFPAVGKYPAMVQRMVDEPTW